MFDTRKPHPARWRYYILKQSDTPKPFRVLDYTQHETASTPIGEERKFKTPDEAKLFIENYEQSQGYGFRDYIFILYGGPRSREHEPPRLPICATRSRKVLDAFMERDLRQNGFRHISLEATLELEEELGIELTVIDKIKDLPKGDA